jgi:hypothetical protein
MDRGAVHRFFFGFFCSFFIDVPLDICALHSSVCQRPITVTRAHGPAPA